MAVGVRHPIPLVLAVAIPRFSRVKTASSSSSSSAYHPLAAISRTTSITFPLADVLPVRRVGET